VKVLLRGQSEFIDVPDQPVAPTLPAGAPVARGPEAPAHTPVTSNLGITGADATSAPVILTTSGATSPAPPTVSFAHTDASAQFLAVASAVTDVQLSARGDLGGLADAGGEGEITRGSDTLASLSLDGPAYADHGWFVVPSAANEYGEAYAAADDFAFDVAAGEFSSDWFWV
jgi:hypothetical protein